MICPGFLAEEPPPPHRSSAAAPWVLPLGSTGPSTLFIELFLFAHRKHLPFPEMEIHLTNVNIRLSIEI